MAISQSEFSYYTGTGIFLGTGEKPCTRYKFGAGHELMQAILKARLEYAPEITDSEDSNTIIKEDARRFLQGEGATSKIVNIRRERISDSSQELTHQFVIPPPNVRYTNRHLGMYFSEYKLLVMNGVDPSPLKNIARPDLIADEVKNKAKAAAEHYYNQIIEAHSTGKQSINLFIYGFSRGACTAIQMVNILHGLLAQYEIEHCIDLASKVKVDLFLLDPVPGNPLIQASPHTHLLPSIVRQADIILSEDEMRTGYGALREFYKESDATETHVMVLPGNHSAVKRREAGHDPDEITSADVVTAELEKRYNRVLKENDSELRIPVFTLGSIFEEASRRYLSDTTSTQMSPQIKDDLRERAWQAHEKFFGFVAPLFRAHRRIRIGEHLNNICVAWPTELSRLETMCDGDVNKKKLIAQLKLLLAHANYAKSEYNSYLVYSLFQTRPRNMDCFEHLKVLIHSHPGTSEFRSSQEWIETRLIDIRDKAENDDYLLVKIITVILAVLASICTLGVAAVIMYNDDSYNYFTLQPLTGYLAQRAVDTLPMYTRDPRDTRELRKEVRDVDTSFGPQTASF